MKSDLKNNELPLYSFLQFPKYHVNLFLQAPLSCELTPWPL